jgi:HAE1 family hydrophobic/amphiphilic exporter-1
LEKQFSTIAGIESMTSTSSLGSTSITIQFDLSRNIDAAAQDVQAAISQTQGDLPTEMPAPPSFRKVNPAEQPILMLAAHSESLPLSKVNEYAETLIGQRLSMVRRGAGRYLRAQSSPCAKVDPQSCGAESDSRRRKCDRDANSNELPRAGCRSKSRTIKTTGGPSVPKTLARSSSPTTASLLRKQIASVAQY